MTKPDRSRHAIIGSTISSSDGRQAAAFTRVELLGVVFALALLTTVTIPLLANTKLRGDRLTCANNLRLVGRACNMWANDHDDLNPWWVDQSEGGTQNHQFKNNIWFNFAVMSNELATPMILACPSDANARVASDFSANANGGFLNPAYRNSAVSYFIGLHGSCFSAPPSSPGLEVIATALAGDSNLRIDNPNVLCASGITAAQISLFPSRLAWTNAIHGLTGNILGTDGQVNPIPNKRLVEAFGGPAPSPNITTHLLLPP